MNENLVQHIASGGQNCPYCGTDWYKLSYGELEAVESGCIEQRVECKCGRRWMDVFKLVKVLELSSK